MVWSDFINGIKDEAGTLAKGELIGLIADAGKDKEEFIRKQSQKVQRYLEQLAAGEITKDQFVGYMEDIRDLTQMQALKLAVDAKARAQKLASGIEEMIINKLVALI